MNKQNKAGVTRSRNKSQNHGTKRVSGQPIDPKYRYMELIVDNDWEVANAIKKIVDHAGTSKKEAIQNTLIKVAGKL